MRVARLVSLGLVIAVMSVGTAGAVPGEVSTSSHLQDRRAVTAGQRSYAVGFEDGRFYANGWHITGEMGGVWAPPIKLVDGVWFGLDGQWVGQATKFFSGWATRATSCPTPTGCRCSASTSRLTGIARWSTGCG